MIRMIAGLLLAWPATLAAQQLHKCVDARGHASYQSAPCEAGQRQVWVRDAAPEPVQPTQLVRPATARQVDPPPTSPPLAPLRASGPASAQLPAYPARVPSACEAAKQRRESTLRKVGLKRDFNLLRRLDDAVWNACR